jgi:DNA-binding NtrC family response regulator
MAQVLSSPSVPGALLVVSDEVLQLDAIRDAAERVGLHNVRSAPSESDAYTLIEGGEEFPLAVVDIMLTSKRLREGLRVIERLRGRQPRCRIIALTNKGGNEIGVEALRRGATDFVCDDWDHVNWWELLQQRLALWLGVARSERSAGSQ